MDDDAFQRVDQFVQQVLPSAHAKPLYTKTCLYTMPPDRDFVLDALPDNPNVIVAIGAGHAFKFASVLGKTLGELALVGKADSNIAAFGITRPILLKKNPPKSLMV